VKWCICATHARFLTTGEVVFSLYRLSVCVRFFSVTIKVFQFCFRLELLKHQWLSWRLFFRLAVLNAASPFSTRQLVVLRIGLFGYFYWCSSMFYSKCMRRYAWFNYRAQHKFYQGLSTYAYLYRP